MLPETRPRSSPVEASDPPRSNPTVPAPRRPASPPRLVTGGLALVDTSPLPDPTAGRRLDHATVHDLRAPLNAMAIHLDLLRSRVRDGAPSEDCEHLIDVVAREIGRLDRSLRTLVAGGPGTAPEEAARDLREMLVEVLALVGPMARRQHVEILEDLPDAAFPVRSHADLLRQVLLNLVLNALEAMPAGGRLSVSCAGGLVRIADDGPGMAPEIAERAFEAGFTTKARGSGIGLAEARSIVEDLGGTIRLEDGGASGGRGATVVILLPAAGMRPAVRPGRRWLNAR